MAIIMETDPYYWTQDNGAGGPVHFATTYKQIDMLHHILRHCPEAINQRDPRGFTPLHRAAYLAQYDGYLELYEYLLSEGADPKIKSEDYDPYLNPGKKTPIEVAISDDVVRGRITALEEKYAHVTKKPEPHPDIGEWWTLYDYGPDVVSKWPKDYIPDYPEERRRARHVAEKKQWKAKRAAAREAAVAAERATNQMAQLATGPGAKTDVNGKPVVVAAAADDSSAASAAPPLSDSPVAFLFPGQGSQAVGMLKSVAHLPAVKAMCDEAKQVLGYDLLDVCVNGPKEKLDDTVYSQPALFVAGLAAVEKLRTDDPEVVARCSRTAGLSLGEYTSLVFSGAMSFSDGLKVVKVRAESMAAAAKVGDHGMLSVVGLADDVLKECCAAARAKLGEDDCVCAVANHLFPQGRVVSGDKAALEEVTRLATAKGAMKCAQVAVSGAFHTSRMSSARDALVEVLKTITINPPKIPVYSNVTGQVIEDHEKIPEMLAQQLVSPVLWEDTMKNLITDGKEELYELGPKNQIKSMTKRINSVVWKKFKNVDVSA